MIFFKVRCSIDKLLSIANLLTYRSALFSCGKKVYFGKGVKLEKPRQISIGNNVTLLQGVKIKSRNNKTTPTITLGDGVKIHESTFVDDYGGKIIIGENTGIGHFCVIAGHGGLSIGHDCMVSGCTYIIPANHTFTKAGVLFRNQPESKKGIIIGDNVWIGAGCVILDGVVIGSNTVIGAGSIVTKNIPANVVAYGNPARVTREINS